jgi:Flp pilus assembly protein TadB
MRQFLIAIALFISSMSFSQDTLNNATAKDSLITTAATNHRSYSDSIEKEDLDRINRQSVDFFVRYQKEQRARQKKQAILYLCLGGFFLVVLIVGLRRKRKR